MKKIITILGEEVTIAFNMATEMAYERITKQSFDLEQMKDKRNIIALYTAAVIANNKDTKITFESIAQEASMAEIKALDEAVSETMRGWLNIPEVIPPEKKIDGEEQPKN
jgi:hypothetical protein